MGRKGHVAPRCEERRGTTGCCSSPNGLSVGMPGATTAGAEERVRTGRPRRVADGTDRRRPTKTSWVFPPEARGDRRENPDGRKADLGPAQVEIPRALARRGKNASWPELLPQYRKPSTGHTERDRDSLRHHDQRGRFHLPAGAFTRRRSRIRKGTL
jgi:hypothetical protein